MKASEVLRRYAAGERDFRRVNLRGQSFREKDLSGADFSDADIRSTNFVEAILLEAKFSGAKAGLQPKRALFLFVVSLLLSELSGIYSGLNAAIASLFIEPTDPNSPIFGIIGIIIFAIFFVFTIRKGLRDGLLAVAIAVIIAGVAGVIFAITIKEVDPGEAYFFFSFISVGVALPIIGSLAVAVPVACAGLIYGIWSMTIATSGAAAVALLIAIKISVFESVGGIFGLAITLLGAYMSWQAVTEDDKQTWIRGIAATFASTGGTNFRKANLTNTDFTKAQLGSTDFREAMLIRTFWKHSTKLKFARLGNSYPKNAQLRNLVVSGNGRAKNFDRLELRGFNLQDADLEDASFIDADLYQANLQQANLSKAKLVRANLERADLRGANLTGSCIQDWTISRDTKLDGIICEYVYLKWVNGDKIDQMPPRGKFQEGGFVTFVRYILETVELYHEKDINPRLALAVLQKMSKDYDEPFDIVALGKKGERVFIQVKVSENVIREKIQEDYYSRYETNLKLWSGNIHQFPPTVNNFLEKRISEIASQKTDDLVFVDATYAEGNYTEIYQGEVNMSGDRNIHMGSGNYNERIEGDYVQGNYYTAGPKQTLAETAAEIQQLLEQLEKSYATDTMTGKMTVATEVIKRIESNPPLMNRVLSALKAGGVEALAQALNHPAASFVIGALEDWQKTKGN